MILHVAIIILAFIAITIVLKVYKLFTGWRSLAKNYFDVEVPQGEGYFLIVNFNGIGGNQFAKVRLVEKGIYLSGGVSFDHISFYPLQTVTLPWQIVKSVKKKKDLFGRDYYKLYIEDDKNKVRISFPINRATELHKYIPELISS